MFRLAQGQWQQPSPAEIHRNMDDFMSKAQSNEPDAPDFAVDLRGKKFSIVAGKKSRANRRISEICRNHYPRIPWDEIVAAMKAENIVPLQEDGTKWAGMIGSQGECGSAKASQAPMRFALCWKLDATGEYVMANNFLIMTACTMPSNNLEIVAYIS